MTDRQSVAPEPVSEELFEEAVSWHTSLREASFGQSSGSDGDLIARFEAWQSQSPDNARAFAEVEELWGRLALPIKRQLREAGQTDVPSCKSTAITQAIAKPHRLMRFVAGAAMAACLMLFVGVEADLYPKLMGMIDDNFIHAEHEVVATTLPDGSVVMLNAGSSVSVDFTANTRSVDLVRGEVWFDVAHDKQRPFIVRTKFGDVTALGTVFNIRSDKEQVTVSLEEGKIAVKWAGDDASDPRNPNSKPDITLLAGETTTLSPEGVGDRKRFDRIATTAWRKGKMVFYQTPLSDVIDVINSYHDGHIIVVNPELNNLAVSGVFRTDDINQVIDAIEGTFSVRVVRLSNYMILLV